MLTTYGRSSGFCIDPVEKNRSTISTLALDPLVRHAGATGVQFARTGHLQVARMDGCGQATRGPAQAALDLKCSRWHFTYTSGDLRSTDGHRDACPSRV